MNEKPTVVYTGLFVKDVATLTSLFEPVHKNVFAHHMTIEFRPKDLSGVSVGEEKVLKIIGRVVDDKADVLLVDFDGSSNKFPHITLSTAKGVPPIYSNELCEKAEKNHLMEYFNEPTEIEVVEGYFDGEKDIVS